MVLRMSRRPFVALAAVAAVALLAAGCSGGDEPKKDSIPQVSGSDAGASTIGTESSSPTVTETPQGPSDADIEKYFSAVASEDPAELRKALPLTEKGSPAEAYLQYQVQYNEASIAGGFPNEAATIRPGSGSNDVAMCFNSDCTSWKVTKASGDKIVDIAADGSPVGKRISVGNGSKTKWGSLGTIEVLSAYVTNAGSLVVTLEAKAGSIGLDMSYIQYHIGPDGRQVGNEQVIGPSTLQPGASSIVAMNFPGSSKLGGRLHLKAASTDDSFTVEEIDVPLK
jgi:hypothetical protein